MGKTTILGETTVVINGETYLQQTVKTVRQGQRSTTTKLTKINDVVAEPPTSTRATAPGGSASFAEAGYGGAIPIVFGSDKIAGNIIWASTVTTHTVLVNDQNISFSSVNFALGLCEGEIQGILRIWMGDRLIFDNKMSTTGNTPDTRNGAVDSTVVDITEPGSPLTGLPNSDRQTRITVYNGSETQTPPKLMTDADGYSNTPGYRGLAYILFENFITAGTDIPSLTVETSSNTTVFYPRLESTIPAGSLTDIEDESIVINPVFKQVHVFADNGAVPTLRGLVTYNANTLAGVSNVVYDLSTLNIPSLGSNWRNSVVTNSGIYVLQGGTGNPGVQISINAVAGAIIDSLGPGPAFTIDETGFPATLMDMHAFSFKIDANAPYQDAVAICDNWSESIGIIYVGDFGELTMGPYLDQGVTYENVKICWMPILDVNYANYPTFVDGEDTLGNFFFYIGNDDAETTEFSVGRVELGPALDVGDEDIFGQFKLTQTVHTAKISFEEFNGTGLAHSIQDIIANPTDATLIVCVNSTFGDWVFKYNPYTDTVVWKTQVTLPLEMGPSHDAVLTNQEWAWIANNTLYSLDLKTGQIRTVVDDIVSDQGLQGQATMPQYYDGYERSIIYVSASQITKVFFDRQTVGITSLPTIIETLLNRVNYNRSRYNLSSVSALNLRGFTIREVATLRDILTTLRQVYTFEIVESNGRIQYIPRGSSSAATIANKYLGDLGEQGSYLETTISPDLANLRKINFTYSDVDREYMTNVQSVYYPPIESLGFDNDAAIDVKVPIVLTADEARYNADKLLYAKRLAETSYQARVPFRYSYLDPGDIVTIQIDDAGNETIVARITRAVVTKDFKVEWELVQDDPDIYGEDPGFGGVIGRFYSIKFAPIDPYYYPYLLPTGWASPFTGEGIVYEGERNSIYDTNYVAFLDYTQNSEDVSDSVRFTADIIRQQSTEAAAARGSTLVLTAFTPKKVATWGFVRTPPSNPPNRFSPQTDNSITIAVMNDRSDFPFQTSDLTWDDGDFWTGTAANPLERSNEPSLYGNLILVGEELMRFHTVTDNGDGTYTLSKLIRALNNTDFYYNKVSAGDIVILIRDKNGQYDSQGLKALTGETFQQTNLNAENAVTTLDLAVTSNNPYQRPLSSFSPAYRLFIPNVQDVVITLDGSNEYVIDWTRRSLYVSSRNENPNIKKYDEWSDDGTTGDTDIYWLGADTPLHDIYVSDSATINSRDSSTYLRKTRVSGAVTWTYTAAMQTADGFDYTTDTLYVQIVPVSTWISDVIRDPETYSLAP